MRIIFGEYRVKMNKINAKNTYFLLLFLCMKWVLMQHSQVQVSFCQFVLSHFVGEYVHFCMRMCNYRCANMFSIIFENIGINECYIYLLPLYSYLPEHIRFTSKFNNKHTETFPIYSMFTLKKLQWQFANTKSKQRLIKI